MLPAGDRSRSLQHIIDGVAGQRSRVGEPQLVGRYRKGSLLLHSDLIRKRAGLDAHADSLGCLIDGVCAEVGDRSFHNRFVFRRRRLHRILRRKLRKVGTREDDNEAAVRVEDVDALRIGTKSFELLPSLPTCSQETAVQVPASCSLRVFSWAVAAPGSMSANAGITERLKM